MNLRFLSVIQYSTGDPEDHILNFNIKQNGKEAAKDYIERELIGHQMMEGTDLIILESRLNYTVIIIVFFRFLVFLLAYSQRN